MTAASTFELAAAANAASPPPRQKPTTPTPLPSKASCPTRWSTAPDISFTASSMFMAIIFCWASSGCSVVSPWYRSGASAAKPSAAKRSTRPLTWSSTPHHSWSTTTPGPLPDSGTARYPEAVPPLASNSTSGMNSVSSRLLVLELAGELEAHSDSHEHSHPGLLGQQRADPPRTLTVLLGGRRRPHLRLVGFPEPAPLLHGLGQYQLKLGRQLREPPLCTLEALGIGQRLDGGIHLLVREHRRDTTRVQGPRLTTLSHGAGCACKLPAPELQALLSELPVTSDVTDDAAVLQIADDLALVSTADFFTPIVDDPYDFGRIAAANALSDVYAMGATPVLALNLVAWPLEALGRETLREVLRGGAAIAAEAGVPVAGGHSIDDPEPKYGLAVTGRVHPDRVVRNSGGRAGDELFLTKPVGGGVASTALKRGRGNGSVVAAA